MKKYLLTILFSLFVISSCSKQQDIENKLNNNSRDQTVKNIVGKQVIDRNPYSEMTVEERLNANCNSLKDSFENAFCKENQKILKEQEFYYNTDKTVESKMNDCSNFSNKIGYTGSLSEVTKCRIKLINISERRVGANGRNQKLDCSYLSKYGEEEVCKKNLESIKRYNQYKNDERIYNDIVGIR